MTTYKVIIETPRFSFIKRKDDGSIDYISPFPCPFNYGSVPDTVSGDGDRLDAVVLGKRLPRGENVTVQLRGIVNFTDKGEADPKYICSDKPLSIMDKLTIISFFKFFSLAKRLLNKVKGKKGETGFSSFRVL